MAAGLFRPMIRIGPAGYPDGHRSPADSVRKVRAAGLSALEIQFVRNVRYDPSKAEHARREAAESDVLLSVHAPYYVNLNSSSQETRDKSEEWVLRAMRGAEAFGAWIVVVHAATYGEDARGCTARVTGSLKRVRKIAEREALKAVIGLETMGKKAAWGTVPEILDAMGEVPGILPVVDFAHLQARRPPLDERALQALLGSLDVPRLHCHLSGIEYTAAGEKKHLRLGQGLDHLMVLDALADSGLEATVICESTSPLEDAQIMERYLDQGI
ncbi:MAG: TIM barrel protein [Euryarchaeota archaeon]|nr:TIM barrel protein [Euryarchaeota archaeon]